MKKESYGQWGLLFLFTVLSAYLYVCMEWLFFVTKPSFLTPLGWPEKLGVLLSAALPGALVLSLLVLALRASSRLISSPGYAKASRLVAAAVPAAILSVLGILLLDNFTYTVFRFGIKTSAGLGHAIYLLLLAVVFVSLWRGVYRRAHQKRSAKSLKLAHAGTVILLAGSMVPVLFNLQALRFAYGSTDSAGTVGRRPNILLIASDGVNATHMSVYGYQRDTTPFLKEMEPEFLFCENAFTNAAHTGASIASMLSGRLPTQTRLIYPPDILRGKDSYRHLPALLRSLGYRTADISIRHYADAYDLNLRNGFDEANSRTVHRGRLERMTSSLLGQDASYFIGTMWDRLKGRTLQLAGESAMDNAFEEAAQIKTEQFPKDSKRLKELFDFIRSGPGPFFVHVHLMGTHGPTFRPRDRLFSQGEEQTGTWMTDFSDDAIRGFDEHLRRVFDFLKSQSLLEHTVIVINSDHGQDFQPQMRIPLMFRFPNRAYHGHIRVNVENLDIGPTLLDYLQVRQPRWMGGQSLLSGRPDPLRPIFSAKRNPFFAYEENDLWQMNMDKIGPPFYSLGSVTVVVCQNWYRYDLTRNRMTSWVVEGHTQPCDPGKLPSPEQVRHLIIHHLKDNGYDTSKLEKGPAS